MPSEGSDTGSPSPRKDKVASSAIELAICTVATTISGGMQLGNTWRNATRAALSGVDNAASTYSLERSAEAAPCAVRAK